MQLRRAFAVLFAAACVSACGGGGATPVAQATVGVNIGGGATPTPTPTPTPRPSGTVSKSIGQPTPTSTPGQGATPTPLPTVLVAGEVYAGAGYSDVSPHQLVRTSRDVLYLAVPTCGSYPLCASNTLGMEAATTAGVPVGFAERDAVHRLATSSGGRLTNVGSSALAIDGNDVIWVVYDATVRGGTSYETHATSFDTRGDRWGSDAIVGPSSVGPVTQGREGVAVAIDRAGIPHAVFNFSGVDGTKHVAISTYAGGGWTSAVQVDDASLAPGQGALHPTVAMTPQNDLLVAWLAGNENVRYNNPDGTIHVRQLTGPTYATGPASVAIPDTNFRGNPGYAATTIDQGPSMMVAPDGNAVVTYLDTSDDIRFWYSTGANYQAWNGDRQPGLQQTHDPSLGPDGTGGLYIYGHGTPQGTIDGHGNNLYRMRLAPNADAWTPFVEIVADRNLDCSVSTRWSQFFDTSPNQVDFTYWNDHYPNQQYESSF